jgi:hypothetical protein
MGYASIGVSLQMLAAALVQGSKDRGGALPNQGDFPLVACFGSEFNMVQQPLRSRPLILSLSVELVTSTPVGGTTLVVAQNTNYPPRAMASRKIFWYH